MNNDKENTLMFWPEVQEKLIFKENAFFFNAKTMIYIDLIWRGDLLLLPWFEWKTSVTVTIYVKTSTEVTIKKK